MNNPTKFAVVILAFGSLLVAGCSNNTPPAPTAPVASPAPTPTTVPPPDGMSAAPTRANTSQAGAPPHPITQP